jgi:hypothetical protein
MIEVRLRFKRNLTLNLISKNHVFYNAVLTTVFILF